MDEDLRETPTEDLQHDLAIWYADNRRLTTLTTIMTQFERELKVRGEPLPTNCRWEFSPYARNKKKLLYTVGTEEMFA